VTGGTAAAPQAALRCSTDTMTGTAVAGVAGAESHNGPVHGDSRGGACGQR
jgi:hypothetical protein